HLDRANLGARLGDADEHLLLLGGVALHGVHQIGNEIGAALVLIDDLGPGGFDALILLHHAVVTAAREAEHRRGHDRTDPRTHRTSPCVSTPPHAGGVNC